MFASSPSSDQGPRQIDPRSFQIAETSPDSAFDRLTFLASEVCETSMALINLIGEKNLWLKSRWGLESLPVPCGVNFCDHTILGNQTLIVQDTWADPRFQTNPWVLGPPFVRFYAGALLINHEGTPVGTLCVMDTAVKSLSSRHIQILETLAQNVMSELEKSQALRELDQAREGLKEAHRKVESELLESRKLLSEILQALPVMVFAKDIQNDFRFTLWNKAAENITGIHSHDCLGKTDYDLFPREQADFFRSKDRAASEMHGVIEIPDELISTPTGASNLRTKKSVIRNQKGEPAYLLGVSEDITAATEAEQLIQMQRAKLNASAKLSALGEMAAGIAHEINNPLAIISARAQVLRCAIDRGLHDPQSMLNHINKIEDTVGRIAKIIRGLRSFSRDSERDPMELVGVEDVIAETLDLCQERIKSSGVELRLRNITSVKILCRSAQISQILMNLISNSYDAIEGLPQRWIEISTRVQNEKIQVVVVDSGPGIPKSVADKILQPFFTTKEVGKGTGLGLSISKGLAEVHGGCLIYDSASPHTRFILELPLKGQAPRKIGSLKSIQSLNSE